MIDFEEEKAITIDLLEEEPIEAEVIDINYIPAYKQAELERQANEKERQNTYQELTKMIDEGKVTGIYMGEKEPTDEMVDVWIDPNGNPEVEASHIVFSDNETLQTKYENGELKGDKGEDGIVTFESLTEEQKASLKGEKGDTGEAGYTPIKGVDYFTSEDITSLNIPTKTSDLTNDSGFLTEVKEVYSTEEQVIGTWVNNKPVYRKVIQGTTPTTENNWGSIGNVPEGILIRKIEGVLSDYLPVPNYINSDYYLALQYNGSANAIQCYTKGYVNTPISVIVEYTKTTD